MDTDVIVIGAGPAGSVAAALLAKAGWRVTILEKTTFPRFSIGESLLPQLMTWVEEAGLLQDIVEEGFQQKNGAIFQCGDKREIFNFREKSSPGWSTTFQVRRDRFDELLARRAENMGVRVLFGQTVTDMRPDRNEPSLQVLDDSGTEKWMQARMVLDASGFGRVLARLLGLESPSAFPSRTSYFSHFKDRIPSDRYDRNKILISVHPNNESIWYWLIPFSDGHCSVGVVGETTLLEEFGQNRTQRFEELVSESGYMAELLTGARTVREVQEIAGYACKVSGLTGPGYALLGNAGEFLDPIFSSGVTIAIKSAHLAARCADRQLRGEQPDWTSEFEEPLAEGVDTFRAYVEAWYDGSLQKIIFNHPRGAHQIRSMITSVLAGYAWDRSNPFVRDPRRYLKFVASLCG